MPNSSNVPDGGAAPQLPQDTVERESPTVIRSRSLLDYLFWYLRYSWLLILTTVTGLLIGYYVYNMTPPVYQSWAVIEIERVMRDSVDIEEDTKLELRGAGIIAATVEKLKMPAVYEAVANSDLFLNRKGVIPERRRWRLPWNGGEKERENEVQDSVSPGALAGMMKGWVDAKWRGQTNLIDLYAKHTDPEVARDTLRGLLVEYERMSRKSVSGSEDNALEYILEATKNEQESILKIETALNRYNGCLEKSRQIDTAETAVIELEKRYLPKWPPLVEEKEMVRILKNQFEKELQGVITTSPEEQEFWRTNLQKLEGLEGEDLTDGKLKLVESRASLLATDLESRQKLFETWNTKLKEAGFSKGFTTKEFEVPQEPTLPGWAGEPNRNAILKKYCMGGFFIGAGLIFLLGWVDPSMRTVTDLEAFSGVPVVGAIPITSPGDHGERRLVLLDDNESQVTEAIRTLRAGLSYLGDQEERCSFLVTSALASEGKSWVAANLAVAFAQQGDRTLLVDMDLRKPVQSNTFNLDSDLPGVTDVMSQQAMLSDIVVPLPTKNLYFLSAGGRTPNPSELMGSRNLPVLAESLAGAFDRVIYDTSPMVLVSDALPIAKLVDSVLLVYRMGKTPRRALDRLLKTLQSNGTPPAGIVANGLPRSRRKGSYGYYYSYYGGAGYGGYGDSAVPDSGTKSSELPQVPSVTRRTS